MFWHVSLWNSASLLKTPAQGGLLSFALSISFRESWHRYTSLSPTVLKNSSGCRPKASAMRALAMRRIKSRPPLRSRLPPKERPQPKKSSRTRRWRHEHLLYPQNGSFQSHHLLKTISFMHVIYYLICKLTSEMNHSIIPLSHIPTAYNPAYIRIRLEHGENLCVATV